MAQKTRTELDAYFNTGDTPTEAQFQDLIDSVPNFQDDNDHYGKDINITAFNGGGQANAYQLANHVNIVTVVANPGDSVKLPTGNIVRAYFINNSGACAMNIYPPVGGQISNAGVNVPFSLPINSSALIINYDNLLWMI